MKKIFFLAILISLTGFSQQLKYAIGGRVYNSENEKIKTADVRQLFKDNKAALTLYNAGRSKKTWGNALLYGGLGLATINLITAATIETSTVNSSGEYSSKRASPVLAIAGGVMALASIPVKIGYTKKIKSAIDAYNKGTVYNERVKPDGTLLASTQGISIRMQF